MFGRNFLYKLGSFSCVVLSLFILCVSVSATEISQEELNSYAQGVTENEPAAADPENIPEDEVSDQTDSPVVYTEENPLYVQVETVAVPESVGVDPVVLSDDQSVSVLAALSPVGPEDTNGLKSILISILGDYNPIIIEYQSGNYTSREVFEDQVWLCSFWMLAIMVFCIFRMLGGWLTRKR